MSDIEVIEIGQTQHVVLAYDTPDPLEGAVVVSVTRTVAGGPAGSSTRLDDLSDVDAPPSQIGVLTRSTPGGNASFVAIPAPPPLPQRHTQTAASARWQITHNLGYRPHFDVRDTEGRPHLPETVEHPIPGVLSEIVFGVPMTGTADPS